MFEMLKKAFATDPISKEDAYGLIKEFTAVLETRVKKLEREIHLQATILSKRIDSLELDLKNKTKKLVAEDKSSGPKIIVADLEKPTKRKQPKNMSKNVKRGRPRIMAPAAKLTPKVK